MNVKSKNLIYFIIVAFTFSFVVRLIWIVQFNDMESFKFNDQFMINTNDGYYWAEGAKDIITQNDRVNELSPINTIYAAPSLLTAWIHKILPIDFETLILYLPAFLSSLIVIPIVLIGYRLDNVWMGFLAALIASIAWSYYNRTMVGYYDTDMLNIVFPVILLYSLIFVIESREKLYLLILSLDIIIYRWWYPPSYSLEFAFFSMVFLYSIYRVIKKEDFKFEIIILVFMLFSMSNLNIYYNILGIVCLFITLKYKEELVYKNIYYIAFITVVIFLVTGGFDPIWNYLKTYIFKESVSTTTETLSLHFFTVIQTIREAGSISFETFTNRISGNIITFIFAFIGYLWLCYKHRIMLLGLPMLGLGFLAYVGGLRFTIYAVPIMAFGISFLIFQIANFIKIEKAKYLVIVLLSMAVLYPNINHVVNYKVPTVFNKEEVIILDKLKHISDKKDYTIAWWDYGYPIRYYSETKTLIDGGKHDGRYNFPVSFMLTQSQDVSSKLMRLDVEYTEKRYILKKQKDESWHSSNIGQMTLDYKYDNTNDFLLSLRTDLELPKKTREIYVYLPFRMLNIYPTVDLFSNIDLMTSKKGKRPFFYKTRNFKDSKKILNLGNDISLNKTNAKLTIGNNTYPLKRFVKTSYQKNGKLQKSIQNIDSNSNLNVIFMSNYNTFLVVEERVYNSLYFQLFILENYNKNLFKPIITSPNAKVYKLLI